MFTAKLRTDALAYEQKLTEAYEAHKSAVQSRSLELASKDEELQQGQQAMHQWRSQWEEELTEKNSIDAELLTLRSEFEKSSATYDREIEGLKDMLEKARTNNEEQQALLAREEAAVRAGEELLEQRKAEQGSLGTAQDAEQRSLARAEQHLEDVAKSAEEWRLKWEAGVQAARAAEAELQLAEQALKGGGASASDAELQAMRAPTLTPHPTPTPTPHPHPNPTPNLTLTRRCARSWARCMRRRARARSAPRRPRRSRSSRRSCSGTWRRCVPSSGRRATRATRSSSSCRTR